MILSVLIFEKQLIEKYIYSTLTQFGITKSYNLNDLQGNCSYLGRDKFSNVNYISDEHSKLIKSGIEIFKLNPITNSQYQNLPQILQNLKRKNH